jgi:UDP-N-acetyl-D-glucosamine dehydrogenase
MKGSVIGQGYVGLPLALAISEIGHEVFGIDSNINVVKSLNSGKSHIEDISNGQIKSAIASGSYIATNDYAVVAKSDVVIVCVPTPLTKNKLPDLTFLVSALESISFNLNSGSLVIIESTVEPGTTRNLILPLILKNKKDSKPDFELAFSPERIDPRNDKWKLRNTPKLVSGLTQAASDRAVKFYSEFVDEVYLCETVETAETAKLLENSFRLINISFINEVSIFCQRLGIDVKDVINAAATKPYGFMPFYPSVGVGGHCIPVDPVYLANKADQIGIQTRFIDLAVQINKEMPGYFVGRAEEKLGGFKGKKVLVVGLSYKPNVADVRETPVEELINGLVKKGAEVSWHDDLVKEWNGDKSVPLSNNFDLAILATPHDYIDLSKLGSVPILDTRSSI